MEAKKKELFDASESSSTEEWRRLTHDSSHDNVFYYYFYMGEIPHSDNGMFAGQMFTTKDFALNAYEKLNYRLDTDSEFAELLQTEVIGFGVDEPNQGIFIVADPMYANQENFEKYEGIFRDIIEEEEEEVPIRFEVSGRGDIPEAKDPDLKIFFLIFVPVFFGVVAYYLWRKRE